MTSTTHSEGTAVTDEAEPFIIGNTEGAIRTFDGKISDVRVYNAALNAGEITQIYNSGAGYGDTETEPTAGNALVAWWIGKDGTGTTLTDVKGGYNGTITNGATWTNPSIISSNSSNYNFDLQGGSGTMALTAYNTLISKGAGTPDLRLCQNSTHVLQDVHFNGWTYKPFHTSGSVVDVTMRRCKLQGSAAMNLGADSAVSKFHYLFDCEFVHDGGTPITVGQAYLLMKGTKLTNGTSSFNTGNYKFNGTNISLGHADAFVASKGHDGVPNRYFIHGSNVSNPTTASYSFSKYSWLQSSWQFDKNDEIYFEDFTQAGAFSLDTDNKETAALTQASSHTIKVESGVFHYTGAYTGGTFGGTGTIDDGDGSPFEYGVKIDNLHRRSADIDGEIAGASVSIV